MIKKKEKLLLTFCTVKIYWKQFKCRFRTGNWEHIA